MSQGSRSKSSLTAVQLSGSLELLSGVVEIDAPDGVIETANYVVDENRVCFRSSALTIDVNGRPRVVSLNAKETELVLKLLRMFK